MCSLQTLSLIQGSYHHSLRPTLVLTDELKLADCCIKVSSGIERWSAECSAVWNTATSSPFSAQRNLSIIKTSISTGPAVLRNLSECVLNSAWEINVPYHIDNMSKAGLFPSLQLSHILDARRGLPSVLPQ